MTTRYLVELIMKMNHQYSTGLFSKSLKAKVFFFFYKNNIKVCSDTETVYLPMVMYMMYNEH